MFRVCQEGRNPHEGIRLHLHCMLELDMYNAHELRQNNAVDGGGLRHGTKPRNRKGPAILLIEY